MFDTVESSGAAASTVDPMEVGMVATGGDDDAAVVAADAAVMMGGASTGMLVPDVDEGAVAVGFC